MKLKLRAPSQDGAVLCVPPWDELPSIITASARSRQVSQHERDELLVASLNYHAERGEHLPTPPSHIPLLMGGHQPELFHPGVWAKNFALAGLARRVGGVALSLIVDQDVMKQPAIKVPSVGDDANAVRLHTIPFDTLGTVQPYETRRIEDDDVFADFPNVVKQITHDWPFTPMLLSEWRHIVDDEAVTIGERFAAARRCIERRWGCANLELPVSRLVKLRSYAEFVHDIETRLGEFRKVYNGALRVYRERHRLKSQDHPAPDLAEGERPFWHVSATGRSRPFAAQPAHELRPRALTLTLFCRLKLADFFLHGLGGGLYDEVTDQLAQDFYGVTLPRYGIFTQTSRLPLPGFPGTQEQVRTLEREARDRRWNPHRFLPADSPARREFQHLLKADQSTKQARRDRTRKLRIWKADHTPLINDGDLQRLRSEVHANALLHRRESAWLLYDEATLKPRMTQFL